MENDNCCGPNDPATAPLHVTVSVVLMPGGIEPAPKPALNGADKPPIALRFSVASPRFWIVTCAVPLLPCVVAIGSGPGGAMDGWNSADVGGTIVTAGGLVFIGGSMDEMFHAFDSATGELLWEYKLPAGGYATPSTYMAGGKQFVIIAAGGAGKLRTKADDQFVAFALP